MTGRVFVVFGSSGLTRMTLGAGTLTVSTGRVINMDADQPDYFVGEENNLVRPSCSSGNKKKKKEKKEEERGQEGGEKGGKNWSFFFLVTVVQDSLSIFRRSKSCWLHPSTFFLFFLQGTIGD